MKSQFFTPASLKAKHLLLLTRPAAIIQPPPRYELTLDNSLPDYTNTDELARQKFILASDAPPPYASGVVLPQQNLVTPILQDPSKVDIEQISNVPGVRMHAKKKAKQAAKKAQVAKYASDGEENNDEGNADEGGGDGNGEGSGGAGGAGGGDDGNGGDEDWDDWLGTDKKNKKKTKKKKDGDEEEEEADEVNDANDDDDSGAKKKKGKKGAADKKDDLTSIWATAGIGDTNADDDWGEAAGKKGKKEKKKKVYFAFIFEGTGILTSTRPKLTTPKRKMKDFTKSLWMTTRQQMMLPRLTFCLMTRVAQRKMTLLAS